MRNDFENNYLEHHGILGQRWGHKNGPPYPLDASDKSAAEKKAKKSLGQAIKDHNIKKKRKKSLEKARVARQKNLDAKKTSDDFSKKKDEILRSGDPKQILKYRKYMSDNEVQSALNRIRNEQALKDMVKASEKSGMDKIDNLMKTVGKVQSWAEIGIKTYDTTADLYNTFIATNEEEKWKKIRSGKDKKKKKKDDDEAEHSDISLEDNALEHHGILGQKWGVRRYQNDDGSLTPAGRERYGVGEGKGVSDISSSEGIKKRTKDLKKAIKINDKKRGKEYTKIANNRENFLGLNKKHADKISEYSENIKKGKEELDKLNKLQENLKNTKKDQKQLSKEVKESVKKNGWNGNDEAREKIKNAVSKEQQETLRKKYKEWEKAFNAEEAFYESNEYKKAHDDAYDDTFNWYKKNEPDQLNSWIKNNGGKTTGLDAYHDFRKTFEGYDDEYTSKAHESYNKSNNIDSSKEKQLWEDYNNYAKDVTSSIVGKYGNTKLDVDLNTGKKFNVNDYVKSSIMTTTMVNGFKKKK